MDKINRSKSMDRDRGKSRDPERSYHNKGREWSPDYLSRNVNRNKEYDNQDKNYSSQRNKSKSKKSKHTKRSRHHHRNRSSSESSTSSSSSSRTSHTSHNSKHSKPKANKVKTVNSDGNSHGTTLTTTPAKSSSTNSIDLLDVKVQKTLETIEEDNFVATAFFSTRDREAPTKPSAKDKVIIDLSADTVTFSKPEKSTSDTNEISLFHPNFLGDPEKKQEKWVRKLFIYRQKCMNE